MTNTTSFLEMYFHERRVVEAPVDGIAFVLSPVIRDPLIEMHIMCVNDVPAGLAELDRRVAGQIELSQFGLAPEFIGKGFGKYFLQWVIAKAFSYGPKRFWLHTSSQDHPAALPNYLSAGFTIWKQELCMIGSPASDPVEKQLALHRPGVLVQQLLRARGAQATLVVDDNNNTIRLTLEATCPG